MESSSSVYADDEDNNSRALSLLRACCTCRGVLNECTTAHPMSALVPKVSRELTKMRRTLRKTFGLDKLRPGQAEVIRSVLEGNHTLAIMPTGAGKSLCYQLPSLHLEGTTVVVSPLISLMKDQVDKLEDAGLEAAQLNSALTTEEREENLEQIESEQSDFIFVTPERFTKQEFLADLRKRDVNFVVIDEAHCISEWGHDFRPAYLSLGAAVKTLGAPPVLALTATATPEVTADIEKQLDIGKLRVVKTGIYRPNLQFEVKRVTNELEKHQALVRILNEHEGVGIIYCATVKTVEELTDWLKGFDFKIEKYHGRMKASDRKRNQDAFMNGEFKAIVATNAFGMGIDKPDIRFVVHYQMPGSLEAYYQEIGRAGRDGLPSTCVLLFNYADKNTHDFFIEGSYPDISVIKKVYDTLAETELRRIEFSTAEIARRTGERNEMAIQSALYVLERAGHIQRTAPALNRGARGAQQGRSILMLDSAPVAQLRVDPRDLSRRGELERRKLRAMIDFCYTDYCYRAHILNYFGDRNHERECGTCGNCKPQTFAPSYHAEVEESPTPSLPADLSPRAPSEDELLRVRKILACAKRMNGRFGKKMLVSTLRGS